MKKIFKRSIIGSIGLVMIALSLSGCKDMKEDFTASGHYWILLENPSEIQYNGYQMTYQGDDKIVKNVDFCRAIDPPNALGHTYQLYNRYLINLKLTNKGVLVADTSVYLDGTPKSNREAYLTLSKDSTFTLRVVDTDKKYN